MTETIATPLFSLRLGLVGLLVLLFFVGACSPKSRSIDRKTSDFLTAETSYHRIYLTGNLEQARESLHKSIELAMNSPLGVEDRAQSLANSYMALSVLERKCGNLGTSEDAYVRAKYWVLEEVEIGTNTAEVGGNLVAQITPETIRKSIEQRDKQENGGKDPKYIESILPNLPPGSP